MPFSTTRAKGPSRNGNACRALTVTASVACAIGLAHCQAPTEVFVHVTTDVPCDQLEGVTITVGNVGEVETKPSTTSTADCQNGELGTLAVVPSGAKDQELTIKVIAGVKRDAETCTAPGYGTGCIVARRTIRYVEHSKLPLGVMLRSSCNGVVCATDQTCVNGGCASASVSSASCGTACDETSLAAAGPAQAPSPLVCGDAAGLQPGSPWPMLGGCSTHIARSAHVGPQTSRILWKAPVGGAIATGISISAEGTIYAGAGDNKLYAIDPRGTLKWATQLGGNFGATVPAIGRDGTLYVGNNDKNLYALSPAGAVVWKYPIGGALFTSPALGGDGAIYVGGGTGQSSMFALTSEGKLRWQFPTKGDMLSSPVINLGGAVLTGSEDSKLYAVNPDSTSKWTFNVGEGSQTPVIGANGIAYFAGKAALCAVDDKGALRWVTQTKTWASIPAIGSDGTVYTTELNGTLTAFDGTTGVPKWGTALGPSDWQNQPIVGGDGTIYIGSTNSIFYAVAPDGKVKWQLKTAGAIHGPAAIGADGTLYFGSDDKNLYAIAP